MKPRINSRCTRADIIVLRNLIQENHDNLGSESCKQDEGHPQEEKVTCQNDGSIDLESTQQAIALLEACNDHNSDQFEPTIFTSFDVKDFPHFFNAYLVNPYAKIARRVVRHPTDVVFLTHLIQYMTINLGSAILLFHRFSYPHACIHAVYTVWCIGAFTLLMHNHIHNNGVLVNDWAWLDKCFPYVLGPLMGHTWDSYYYHHVKHHHVEGNGPDDLSSTVRYQRDDLFHFLHYYLRFLLLVWLELPLYFIKKRKTNLALRAFTSEVSSYIFFYTMTKLHPRASTFVFLLPFAILRLGLMVGNWGQHALVDELDPNSDFRTSITIIDVMNRACFNDGYHTAHHLNPLRHWRDQPVHFLKSKAAYLNGKALVFHDIDWFVMTIKLLQKDYMYLADRLVPIGDQKSMSKAELADMLRTKTKKFTEDDIRIKFKSLAR